MHNKNLVTTTLMVACALSASTCQAGTWQWDNAPTYFLDPAYETVPVWNGYLRATTPVTTHTVISKVTYPSCVHSTSSHVSGTWTPSYPGEPFPSGTPMLVMDVQARLDGGAGASGSVWLGNTLLSNLTNQQGVWVPLGITCSFGELTPFTYPDGTLLDPNWNGIREYTFGFTTFRGAASGVNPNYGTVQVTYTNNSVVFN